MKEATKLIPRDVPRPASSQLSFRHSLSRRKILEAFAYEDGHVTMRGEPVLTPVLREAVDFYTAERLKRGREAVRTAA